MNKPFVLDGRKIAEDNGWAANVDMYGKEGKFFLLAPNGLIVGEGDESHVGERLDAIGRELVKLHTLKGLTDYFLNNGFSLQWEPVPEVVAFEASLARAKAATEPAAEGTRNDG